MKHVITLEGTITDASGLSHLQELYRRKKERKRLMTTSVQALKNYIQQVEGRVALKTSWGRTELTKILNDEYLSIMEQIVQEANIDAAAAKQSKQDLANYRRRDGSYPVIAGRTGWRPV